MNEASLRPVSSRAYLGLGSNLGDRWAYLASGVDRLYEYDPDLVVSPVYETGPVGGPQDQGPYLNCVVRADLLMLPLEILELAFELEREAHRVRAERFGPRTLDVDVLLIDGYSSDDPVLTVPHPRMTERAFVLAPLEDVEPSAVPDGWRSRLFFGEDAQHVRCVGELVRSSRS